MKPLTLTILILICCLNVFPQKSKSSKAEKLFVQSDVYLNDNDFENAISSLKKALEYDADFVDAILRIGDIYLHTKKYDSAKVYFLKVNDFGDKYNKKTLLNLAEVEIGLGNFINAIPILEKYLTISDILYGNKEKAKNYLQQCKYAAEMAKTPVPFNPINLGDSINDKFPAYFPAITADEQVLIYTVKLLENGRSNEDFFISKKDKDGAWKKSRNLGKPINTSYNEGAQTISPDGKVIFFTVCNAPDGFGSCDIYVTLKEGDFWTMPVNLGPPINTPAFESQPSISSDGKTLYFCSNRKGGQGGIDIWFSSRSDDGQWGSPINLGATINTKEYEQSPFIHPDNATLYFSSNGHPGMGDADLYFSRKDSPAIGGGNWGTPANLGYPINTQNNESSLIVTTNGEHAYFSSDRKDSRGQLDLYFFELYKEARPQSVTYLKGNIFDKKTNQKLNSKLELIDLETGKIITQSESDKVNGEFLLCIPAGKNYALNVSKKGYLFYSENFSLKDRNPENPYLMDIPLQPINVGESVVLKNIFFETNSYQLKDESKAELNKLIQFMKENSFTKIQVSGHTDNTGNAQSNQKLSENRAKSVYDYLIANQLAKTRLSFKGFGSAKPIAPNDTPEGKAQNRRTEFTVTEK